jgi:hypothetical protein
MAGPAEKIARAVFWACIAAALVAGIVIGETW